MTKAEISTGDMQGNYDIKCPSCGSSNVRIDKKGFNAGNACCGWLVCGPIGALFGAKGSSNLQATCMKCGKQFDALSQVKKQWKQ